MVGWGGGMRTNTDRQDGSGGVEQKGPILTIKIETRGFGV